MRGCEEIIFVRNFASSLKSRSPVSGNAIGILAMLVASFGYIVNDTFAKVVSERLPTGEIIFIRGIFATLLILGVVLISTGGRMPGLPRSGAVVIRIAGEVCATILYLTALFNMPIANSTIILQVSPLMVTAASALFLAERVGWRRWSAVIAGFIGVVVIIRPGLAGFDAWSLVVIAAAVFIVVRDLATRLVPPSVSSLNVTLITSLSVTLLGAALAPIETWVMPSVMDVLFLAAAAVFILIAYFFMILTMRVGDPSVSSPFRYAIVVFAIGIGYVVWGDEPDLPMLLGTLIIVVTGVYTFRREARLVAANGDTESETG